MNEFVEVFFKKLSDNPDLDKEGIAKLKVELCRELKVREIPTDIELYLMAPNDVAAKFRKRLQTKPNRSLSGVAPIAIMTSPAVCPHGKCRMCPGGLNSEWGDVPQSYTGAEPATMRGMRAKWDAYLQVFNRLEQYVVTGHYPDKVDLIIMGGTFPAREDEYQTNFIRDSYEAMNDFSELFYNDGELDMDKFKEFFMLPGKVGSDERTKEIQEKLLALKKETTLIEAQKKNETAAIRCIGLTIETKPDWGLLEHGNRMLEQGCTRVELGVQSVYDKPLELIHRGHDVAVNKESVQILKDLGFKLNFHMMIGLPSVDREQDITGIRTLFTDNSYRPDMIKIYPCMVMPKTPLEQDFLKGKFEPINTPQAADIIAEGFRYVEPYCRVMRVQRDIPTYRTIAGVDKTNLRQYVDKIMDERGIVSKDIRSREVGRKNKSKEKPELKIIEYEASGGKEYFISIEAGETLVGFCRLRFPGQQLRKEITDKTALIRELHVYGSAVGIGMEDEKSSQHKGHGKLLLSTAEDIAKREGKDKMVVISGVGVREYYRKFGYTYEGPYMSKKL